MKYARFDFKLIALLALLGTAALQTTPAFASKVPANMVSGTVTSVGGNQIVVDGKSYNVKVGGPLLRQLQSVQVGQPVDLVLNGSPTAAATQVVGIRVHETAAH